MFQQTTENSWVGRDVGYRAIVKLITVGFTNIYVQYDYTIIVLTINYAQIDVYSYWTLQADEIAPNPI